jgi:hypothetical protein
VAAALVALAGCGRREPVKEEPLPKAAPMPPSWRVVQGVAPFLMRGKLRTLRGKTSRIRADLQIDFADVTQTRGTVSFDLLSLEMTSYEDKAKNTQQTREALAWLDLAGEADTVRWATFVIREITSADPRDLASMDAAQRRTRVKAVGDLTLHGHTAPCEAILEATVAFEGTRGRTMHLRTVEDIPVSLAVYEVQPPSGSALAKADQRIVDALVGTADVALDLALEPGSP